MIVFWSLVSILFFAALGVLALNYAVYQWEENQVNELAKKIKPTDDTNSILFKSTSSREFTTFDLGNVAKSQPAQAVQNMYDRALISLKERKYPDWVATFFGELNNIRRSFWKTVQRGFRYAVSLTKPATTLREAQQKDKEEMKQAHTSHKKLKEVDQTVENVAKLTTAAQSATPLLETTPEGAPPTGPAKATQSADSSDGDGATIGITAQADGKSEVDMTLFERLESRILAKLKDRGLGRYAIWLELGDLYLKFDEKEKAREVFALVLKHAEGDEKEFARDRLIGL